MQFAFHMQKLKLSQSSFPSVSNPNSVSSYWKSYACKYEPMKTEKTLNQISVINMYSCMDIDSEGYPELSFVSAVSNDIYYIRN